MNPFCSTVSAGATVSELLALDVADTPGASGVTTKPMHKRDSGLQRFIVPPPPSRTHKCHPETDSDQWSALRHRKGDSPEAIALLGTEATRQVEILGLPIAVGYLE